jgi:hypothetical protein
VLPLLACRSARSSRSTPRPTGRDRPNVTVASRFPVIPSGYHDSLRACASSPEAGDVAASAYARLEAGRTIPGRPDTDAGYRRRR